MLKVESFGCESYRKISNNMNKLLSISKYWAMESSTLLALSATDEKAFAHDINPERSRLIDVADGVAIIPIRGAITAHDTFLSKVFGATTLDSFVRDFQAAIDDSDVKSILLDIDSPGGVAIGIAEVADMIYEARDKKPIYSYIGRHGCSAAYWLASATEKIIANRSAMLGSIGVVTVAPVQEQPDSNGYKNIEIVSSNAVNKRPDPRNETGLSQIKKEIDAIEAEFIASIAKYRNLSADTIRSDFGKGGSLLGAEALSVDMVDALGTYQEIITQLKGENMATEQQAERQEITAQSLQTDHPDIYDAIMSMGAMEGKKAERERLLAIENAAMNGHEELVKKAKTNPEMTAEKLALQIVSAEKAKGTDFIQGLQKAEEKLPDIKPSIEVDSNVIDSSLPVEDQAKALWARDAKLRAEFRDDFDAYLAFRKAHDGQQIKVWRK